MSLASVAPSVWHGATGRAAAHAPGAEATVLPELELARAAQKAVALAQQEKSAWTRADLIKYLGRVLPRTGRDPAAAAALLENLADRALASEFEPVTCLEAPQPGRGAGQLAARGRAQRLPAARRHPVCHARAAGHGRAHRRARRREWRAARDPRAGRARSRRGPHAARGRAGRTRARRAGYGGRAAGCARTRPPPRSPSWPTAGSCHDQRAEAGAGKTRVLAEAARIWAEAGLGPVIGITPSQSARNTLAAGVSVSYNAAQFLGHLPGRRRARGPVPIGPGTLLVIDEASMLSGPDLADLIAYAKARGAKIILAGDISQLRRWKTAAACPCSPERSATPGSPNRPVPPRLGTGRQPAAT